MVRSSASTWVSFSSEMKVSAHVCTRGRSTGKHQRLYDRGWREPGFSSEGKVPRKPASPQEGHNAQRGTPLPKWVDSAGGSRSVRAGRRRQAHLPTTPPSVVLQRLCHSMHSTAQRTACTAQRNAAQRTACTTHLRRVYRHVHVVLAVPLPPLCGTAGEQAGVLRVQELNAFKLRPCCAGLDWLCAVPKSSLQ